MWQTKLLQFIPTDDDGLFKFSQEIKFLDKSYDEITLWMSNYNG